MLLLIYEKEGHFNGMTEAMVTKKTTCLGKHGHPEFFNSKEEAMEAFDALLKKHNAMLLKIATEAHKRNKKKTLEEYLEGLAGIYPTYKNPKVFSLTEI